MSQASAASPLRQIGVRKFLKAHWQRAPLFVPNSLSNLQDLLTPDELMGLATNPRCRSRLITRRGNAWGVRHGPFEPASLRRLPKRGWALLVQDVNLVSRPAHDLMMRFNFIPYARMDDLMVSLAPEGGGVGPHFDSYDVFLLQGCGSRRWEVSAQTDLTLQEDLPLRLLRSFSPELAYDCHPGDLLYLPPGVAHNGVALETCMTYSIGFRSPSFDELVSGFLAYVEDNHEAHGLYSDPSPSPTTSPSMIPGAMLRAVHSEISRLALSPANIRRFLGSYLSEPQPHVLFHPPSRGLSGANFRERLRRGGATLDLASRLLWSGADIFINGELVRLPPPCKPYLVTLADTRRLGPGLDLPEEMIETLHEWHRAGYLLLSRHRTDP